MQLLEVPYPSLNRGYVLVRNHFSVISTGTEGKTVKDARLSYAGKARARKDDVKKVFESARTYGIKETYRMVMNKLDSPSSLGYSCAGEIVAVAADINDFKIGDFVACGGNTANHAEIVAVPVNLCVKTGNSVSLEDAAFTTLGAIALQGIRQADVRLGENCVVIGLGIIGQLTVQMLHAAGVRTVGIDLDKTMVDYAAGLGCDLSLSRDDETLINSVSAFTNGYGADAVIITAGTDSTDPVDLAGELSRHKGKVIIVGGVPTGFKRTNYFKKELDLRMSCSYGPGRYDTEYEEQGIDYPIGFVRWTENRNMQAFVELLKSKKINIKKLITHSFDFINAPVAYNLILEKSEPFLGIVLQYDLQKEIKRTVTLETRNPHPGEVNIGLIGAGSFGQNFLLPALKGQGNFCTVATARPNNAANIASKYGFASATGSADEVIHDQHVNTVFIATRHDSHAEYVLKSLNAGKNVFVEKPLCLYEEELGLIKEAYSKGKSGLMLGFNRRFAPMVQKIKESFPESHPKSIVYRVNASTVSPEHWVHNLKIGGGRIIGEVCHMADLCMYLAGSKITSVSAHAIEDANNLNDSVVVNLTFANGSIANISYFSNGNKKLSKEYFEVYGSGIVAVCNDFQKLNIYGKSSFEMKSKQNKGHKEGIEAFITSIKKGAPAPVSFDDIYTSTLATFKILESIKTGNTVLI